MRDDNEMDEEEEGGETEEEGDKRGINNNRNTRNNNWTDDDKGGNENDDEEEEKGAAINITNDHINGFMRALGARGANANMNTMDEATFMNHIVELILQAPERRIQNYFAELPKAMRVRMYRRLAKFVHPDKNTTNQGANEAFLKLFSSWRHPLPSLLSSSQNKATTSSTKKPSYCCQCEK